MRKLKKPIIGAVFERAINTNNIRLTQAEIIKNTKIYFPDVEATYKFVHSMFRVVGKTP